MNDTAATAQVIIRPPLAWALAVIAGLALDWLAPLPFVPADLPAGWLGALVFAFALALAAWAIVTMTRAGSNVPTNRPTTTIVESGPYRFTRNPIYLGMFGGLIGLAIAFDTLWLLLVLVPFALLLRYGLAARQETHRARPFARPSRARRRRRGGLGGNADSDPDRLQRRVSPAAAERHPEEGRGADQRARRRKRQAAGREPPAVPAHELRHGGGVRRHERDLRQCLPGLA